jgi:hypothetical protein
MTTQANKHSGGCHCGKVRYDVNIDLSQPVIACNCSICGKTGTILAFAPEAEFQLRSGEDALTDYQFASKTVHHLFCNTCGVRSFGRGVGPDGTHMAAINVRCLDDFELDKLTIHDYDGKSA